MGWTTRDSNSGWSKRFFSQTQIYQPTNQPTNQRANWGRRLA